MDYSKQFNIKLKNRNQDDGSTPSKGRKKLTDEEKAERAQMKEEQKQRGIAQKSMAKRLKDIRAVEMSKAKQLYLDDSDKAKITGGALPNKENYKVTPEMLAEIYEDAFPGEGEVYLNKVNLLRNKENIEKGRVAREVRSEIKQYLHDNGVIGNKLKEVMVGYTKLRTSLTNKKKNGDKLYSPDQINKLMFEWAQSIINGTLFPSSTETRELKLPPEMPTEEVVGGCGPIISNRGPPSPDILSDYISEMRKTLPRPT